MYSIKELTKMHFQEPISKSYPHNKRFVVEFWLRTGKQALCSGLGKFMW